MSEQEPGSRLLDRGGQAGRTRPGDGGPPGADHSAGAATVAGRTLPSLWRRYRIVLLGLLALLLAATAIGIVQTRGTGGRLGPRSPEPGGSRALATLLDDRGVAVRRVTDPGELLDGSTSRTVALVAFPDLLDQEAATRLGGATGGTVVLVAPEADPLDAVSGDVAVSGQVPVATRAPDCDEPAAQAAGTASLGGRTYRTADGVSCYGRDGDGSLVLGRTRGGARLAVLGTGEPLTNEHLADEGNAALALNLLGADGSADEVRWLVPGPAAAGSDGDRSVLPSWVGPALLQLLLAGVLLALWRGRRLGPPVTEPLPVVVRAAETVEGRARLYRRAQARDRAAEALRAGALARLVPRLGIDAAGGEPAPEAVVAAVAARSGRPDAEVHAALYGPPPADDAGLVRLTETLDSMVRTTLDPEVPHP